MKTDPKATKAQNGSQNGKAEKSDPKAKLKAKKSNFQVLYPQHWCRGKAVQILVADAEDAFYNLIVCKPEFLSTCACPSSAAVLPP